MSKYILVTSGVCSSLGKGVAAATIGSLLEGYGLNITMVKCDPYINVDAGNISPFQHGEVYVTEDGAETDLDLGNFSRFTSINITNDNCITIGKVYDQVIRNERVGRYNGRTVQVIPHITDEIKRRILTIGAKSNADVVIVEIGGTVGDIESIPFLESARQLIHELGKNDVCTVHLSLIPVITGGELKSKPTQHSVKQLQEAGIQPDILLCRCEKEIEADMRKKLALFCNVSTDAVFASSNIDKSIYELPVLFHKEGIDKKIISKLAIKTEVPNSNIRQWTAFLNKLNGEGPKVTIAMVGKKDYLDECYKSVRESLFHAAITSFGAKLEIRKIDAESLEDTENFATAFEGADGIVIPGNYGQRGFLGLLKTVKYARENNIPYLGIDLGMQLMPIETARSILGWEDADSTEFIQNSEHAIISLPEEQAGLSASGLMQLGAATVKITKGTKLHDAYKKSTIVERHRNKYTFDRKYSKDMTEHGLIPCAISELDKRTEAFEWENHKWGVGVQYHPEFVSRPTKPHPLFTAFIGAALDK
ncbi:MAG: CTP synthase [Spirochaetales bacterium]|nr:CTP synthase [Spirochaetales bacterium]